MELSIETLRDRGAFSGAPVEREVRWKQGDEELVATVFVRRLSYHSAVSDAKAVRGNRDILAGRIAASIVDAGGRPVFTPEDITGEADAERGPLNANLTTALLQVIGEVNNLGKTQSSAS